MVESYTREMALVRVPWDSSNLKTITEATHLFRAEVKRTERHCLTIQVTGRPEKKKVDEFISRMQELAGDVQVERTSPVTISWEEVETTKKLETVVG